MDSEDYESAKSSSQSIPNNSSKELKAINQIYTGLEENEMLKQKIIDLEAEFENLNMALETLNEEEQEMERKEKIEERFIGSWR